MNDHAHLIEVREAADLLGELLQEAGNRAGDMPLEVWRELAEAAVRVAAAASLLAGDGEDVSPARG